MKNTPDKFDKIVHRYSAARSGYDTGKLLALPEAHGILLRGQEILDLGCGSGNPVLRYFMEKGSKVTGIDFSPAALELAKKNFPQAEFWEGDILDMDIPPEKFRLITCIYMFFCLSLEHQWQLLQKVFDGLKYGGGFLFCTLSPFSEEQQEFTGVLPFMGEEFYMSYTKLSEYRKQVAQTGFRAEYCKEHVINDEKMTWWLLTK